MIIDDNEDSVDEEYEDDEYDEEEYDDEVAYKIISGSESKVEKELNILSGAGWSIEKFDSFISNNKIIVVILMSIITEDQFELEIERANKLLYPK
jgi:hypothetical protein|tara:strand:+ start:762 stop:1046 length:285 start_codon:yes stop_codon:yes gene_type:complete